MIKDVYVPSKYNAVNRDPSKSPQEKLEIISNARPIVIANKWLDSFSATLPFVRGISAEIYKNDPNLLHRRPNTLHIHELDVGDSALYSRGIGTRLLQAAIGYALTEAPIGSVRAVNADLGLVNVFVKALEEKNVKVWLSRHEHFGLDSDKCIEEIFNYQPVVEGEAYKVWEVEGVVDPEQVKQWQQASVDSSTK